MALSQRHVLLLLASSLAIVCLLQSVQAQIRPTAGLKDVLPSAAEYKEYTTKYDDDEDSYYEKEVRTEANEPEPDLTTTQRPMRAACLCMSVHISPHLSLLLTRPCKQFDSIHCYLCQLSVEVGAAPPGPATNPDLRTVFCSAVLCCAVQRPPQTPRQTS